MEECVIPLFETAAVVFKGSRWHRRIAESWVTLDIGWFPLIDIAPCGCKSIVKTLARNLRVIRRRRGLGVYRSWMRTSRQRERQQQCCPGKPFLHIVSLSAYRRI
jgi:hypothetical protein